MFASEQDAGSNLSPKMIFFLLTVMVIAAQL